MRIPGHIDARWRPIAAMGAALITATALATPCTAEPKQPPAQTFTNCVLAAWAKSPAMDYNQKQKLAEDCCLNVGGIFNERTHTCYLPVDNITVAEPNPPAVPPPTATAVIPPGSDQRGIQ